MESRNGAETPSTTGIEEAKNGKSKRVTFEVTEAQHQEIKIRATKKGITIKEYMIALVEEELKANVINYIITLVFIYIITLLHLFGDFRRSWLSLGFEL